MRFPYPRGSCSSFLREHLRRTPHELPSPPEVQTTELCDEDLHLSLAICYEIHNGGVEDVDDRWEWEPSLLALRSALEERFEAALSARVARRPLRGDVAEALARSIADDPSPSLSSWMAEHATAEQFRELVVHRSFYQLREADPHTWAIPRLRGDAKAAMVTVQADEYGGGVEERMHSSLFAKTMRAFELDVREGAYVNHLPGVTLATVNLMHLFGLHRRYRGAIVGHLAGFELTSTGPNQRYGDGLRRLGFGPDATHFFDEHVAADEVHGRIAADRLAAAVAAESPRLASDVLFGADSLLLLEGVFARHLLDMWSAGRSSLRIEPAGSRPAA